MPTLLLYAPLAGWSAPLEETPDEVFAQSILGDGVAIDPTEGTLYAPCDGEVLSVAATQHAIAMRSVAGVEILMHVGIDTVGLAGEGFRPRVVAQQHVSRGEPLLEFDIDLLARRARSLITPIIITNGERFELVKMRRDCSVAVGDSFLELKPVISAARAAGVQTGDEAGEAITVHQEHGLHARPAALIANFAKGVVAEVTLRAHGRTANAKSAVSIMALGVRRGDPVAIQVRGEDSVRVIRELTQLILGLSAAPAAAHTAKPAPMLVQDGNRLRGVIASRGLAVGTAVAVRATQVQVEEVGEGVAQESAAFEYARAQVRAHVEQLSQSASNAAREVMRAHLEFLDDWELVAVARRHISLGKSAAYAWQRAVRDSADTLRSLGDARLAERVDDLLDLESQVLIALTGATPTAIPPLPDRAILIAEDLKPSQFVSLDVSKLAGICLAGGGPTSHVAILAAAIGVPMVVALGAGILDVEEGDWLVLDAEHGRVTLRPDQAALSAAEQTLANRRERRYLEQAAAHVDCRTADGERIEVFANLGSLGEAQMAANGGAEGCGLLRTEFLFLERETAPDEEEQFRQYQGIATVLANRPLIIRTLDVGGDKPIAYLPLPREDNPALGLRGIRTSLWRPDLLRTQLRAIVRVQPIAQCSVLLPMVSDVAELIAARRLLDEVKRELKVVAKVRVGVMIETPASALLAEKLAPEVDFFSVGTNDLTQYTLAMDRGNQELAHRIDGLHPAVLRLVAMTTQAAQPHGRLVAVCGGLASDPVAAPVLIGLGVRELSVVPSMIAQTKAVVRTLKLDRCRLLAQEALSCTSAEEVRTVLGEFSTSVARMPS